MDLNIIYYIYIYTHYTIICECIYRDYIYNVSIENMRLADLMKEVNKRFIVENIYK